MTTSDLLNSDSSLLNRESSISNLDQACQEISEAAQTCQELPKLAQTYSPAFEGAKGQLTAEHQAHILERGILPEWMLASCRSADIDLASMMLGYKAKSPGIMLMSAEYGTFQLRPDNPWPSKDGKEPKYRTGKGDYDIFLPHHPTNLDYWKDLDALKELCFAIDGEPYLLTTEGGFKAIMGCQHELPTVAGVGVTMLLTPKAKGEPDLVPGLKRLAEAGFNFIIAFDSDTDPKTIKNVNRAEVKLAKVLMNYGCKVRAANWRSETYIEGVRVGQHKGMDDFIQNNGIEKFRKILMESTSFTNDWMEKCYEHQTREDSPTSESGEEKKKKLPPASKIAEELAEIYRDKLAWESEYQLWRHYSAKHAGLWGIETSETVKGLIHAHLRSKDLPGFNAGYISSIATILQSDLEVTDWDEQTGLIPLRDGVLNQVTQELKPHAPGYRFTWQLPFKWADRAIGCKPIEEFLLKITGNQDIADVLLAYLAAIVTRRSDLQRYLELKGGGGTGKSTYMAIARGLTGDDNTVSSQLKHLENNQFETAKFYGKILALFPDSERWQGEVSVLKQLTGQDPIRYERKGVQQCRDFVYKGMVILSANEAPESRDLTSGQERRKLTIELDIKVPEYEDAELPEQFKPYLPGLLKRVLDIPAAEVRRLIKHTDREVPALAAVKWKQLCETNPIAGWLDEKVVLKSDAKAYVGLGDIEEANRWLFANFCKYQQENGHRNTATLKWFSRNLRDLLKNQLKANIVEGHDRNGNFIEGIGLRCVIDPGNIYPRPVTKMPFCDGFVMDGDGSVMVETLASDGCDGCDGFLVNLNDTENSEIKTPAEAQKNQSSPADGGKNPSNPSHPSPVKVPAITNPSQRTENPSQTPSPETVAKKHTGFAIGDSVEITLRSDYQGQKGKIADIGTGAREIDYYVKIENQKVIVTIPMGADSFPYLRRL